MDNLETVGRAICDRLGLPADKAIMFPPDPLDPQRGPRQGPRWQLAAELAQRQQVFAEALNV
jgi:hypothetical protein